MRTVIVGYEKFAINLINREPKTACLDLDCRAWFNVACGAQVDP